jgi:hypothetical protein
MKRRVAAIPRAETGGSCISARPARRPVRRRSHPRQARGGLPERTSKVATPETYPSVERATRRSGARGPLVGWGRARMAGASRSHQHENECGSGIPTGGQLRRRAPVRAMRRRHELGVASPVSPVRHRGW